MSTKKHPKGYARLKTDMITNLRARGLVDVVYMDKVDEYMDLWEQRQALIADIEARGVTVMDEKRGMEVENRSVSLHAQVSKQMLAVYQALGFKDAAVSAKALTEDDEL